MSTLERTSYQELVNLLYRARRLATSHLVCGDRSEFEAAQAEAERLETELSRRVYEMPF